MDTSTKEELFRKVWAALYEEGNKDELQVREVVDQMYMAVKEPELDIEEVFDKVQREIGTVRNKERRLWWNVIKYAVAVVLPLGLGVAGYILWNGRGNEQQQQMEGYVRPQNAVMLTLAFGKKIAVVEQQLEESLTTDAVTIRRDSIGGLVYEVSGQKNRAAERFNILEVPVAAEYQLRLSDGTVVYLNSDSRLKYPEVFTGNERKVYLEGEAYFEVAKDKEHPFKVMAQGVEVNVLGTHFNVNAYPERPDDVTTLVEGKVRVGRGTRQIVLVPGEQAAASAESLNVKKVDVREYIAWKDGLFVFSRMSLEEIMRQVYRWYGVETVFSDETVRAVTFTGVIDKSMPLEELFKVIETVVDVRFVMDENNQVVITAK